jgi:hypothetical protein
LPLRATVGTAGLYYRSVPAFEVCSDDAELYRHSGARRDRPALDRLRDAEAGVLEGVICLSADRLGRSYAYQVPILEELERFGVQDPLPRRPDARR